MSSAAEDMSVSHRKNYNFIRSSNARGYIITKLKFSFIHQILVLGFENGRLCLGGGGEQRGGIQGDD